MFVLSKLRIVFLKSFSFVFLHTLILIENLGRVPDITFTLSVRMCLYFVVIVTAFTAFSLPAYKHSALLNPSFIESSPLASAVLADSKVLGASTSSVKPFPEVSATSVYVFDLAANTSIYEKNSTLSLPPASTTKLITALVSLDLYNLDDSLAVPTECTQVAGQRVGFLSEEVLTVKDLLYGLLLVSGGDAACTLATGTTTYDEFISLMNAKAQHLHLDKTHLTNPIGLDALDNTHVSSAYDLSIISREVLKNEFLQNVVATSHYTSVSNSHSRLFENTNILLQTQPGTTGIKTGRTDAAGEVLSYRYTLQNKDYLIVVMQSGDRFGDTLKILNWLLLE